MARPEKKMADENAQKKKVYGFSKKNPSFT